MNQENTSAPAENKMGTMPIGKLLFNMSSAYDDFYAGTGFVQHRRQYFCR